jgi:adenylate kinase family enzyme
MRRISVVGNSGSGKTTLARELAASLGIAHLELDAVFHQPGWQELDTETFRARVAEFAAGPAWVVDGNYGRVMDLVWDRADTVVWLDLARGRVMRQLIGRTVRRAVTRAELWNGNREPLANFVRLDPNESIIAWAWTRHREYRRRYEQALADQANAHLTFVRLRAPGEVTAFLQAAKTNSGTRDSR